MAIPKTKPKATKPKPAPKKGKKRGRTMTDRDDQCMRGGKHKEMHKV